MAPTHTVVRTLLIAGLFSFAQARGDHATTKKYYEYPKDIKDEATGDRTIKAHLKENMKQLLYQEKKQANKRVSNAHEVGNTHVNRRTVKPHYLSRDARDERFTLQSLAFEIVQSVGLANYNKKCQLCKIQQIPLRLNGLATLTKLKLIIARILVLWRVERNILRRFSGNGIRNFTCDYKFLTVIMF